MPKKAKNHSPTSLGKFLRELRERKRVTLQDVEDATGIPGPYISQLETGARKRFPRQDRLRIIADYYNATIQEFLEKAGYYDEDEIEETLEQKIEKAFLRVISDPRFKDGIRLKNQLDLDTKRFIIEMYEKVAKEKFL